LVKLVPLATPAIAVVGILLAFSVLPMFIALLVSIDIAIALVFLDAKKHKILFTMATRNILRRKGTTALVIGGLMIGTAIISTSLVVGDTMNNMIVKQATNSLGEVDFGVGALIEGYHYFNQSFLGPVAINISQVQHV